MIDLFYVAKQLFCRQCKEALALINITSEKNMGYASHLFIQCECGQVNKIETSETHVHGKRGPQVYDVNTKAALAMIDVGIGVRQLSRLMTIMGVPGSSERTMKKRERELFKPMVDVARDSCHEAITKECSETRIATPGKGLSVKYDMCWQKRGSGRSYSSSSGVGTAIGQLTGKILDYDLRVTHCAICHSAEKAKLDAKPHNCQKNWSKSAKAMESSTGASLMENIEEVSGVPVDVLIMDDDSATLSRVKEALDHEVKKWSDINHSTKSLGNAFYNLKSKHKTLSTDIIEYYKMCFSYAIQQNKNNATKLKETLTAIVPHSFGIHDKCGNWCNKSIENNFHKYLPHGKPLTDDALRQDVQIIFDTVANNAERLAPAGSTKDVESTNNIYASKAPKRFCFSKSENLKTRVSAAVLQKNIGYSYISCINTQANLLTDAITNNHSEKLSKERKRKRKYSQQPIVKKRRLEKKKFRNKLIQTEKKEGVTYKSGLSLSLVTEDKEIPGIKQKPALLPFSSFTGSCILFDLETSSLKLDSEILQIAALNIVSGDKFDTYIQPNKSIAPSSSAVTGLTANGNILFYNGKPVHAVTSESAFQSFVLWLEQYGQVMLVAHNCKLFDARRLINNMSKLTCYAAFRKSVFGFADTLPLFRQKFPGLNSYSQQKLFEHFCNEKYNAHNAVDDVDSLHNSFKNV
ncbi:uncharacterized protein LOC127714036 [Mytilus californianus]|uniref:uncharacterized protein LOC127714036 n=1 Tax=Mytilus californianus TaxID=6549 RepID=UPI0022469AC4|nr:uncharacterized protein LOC127714036 [Mytilus californianus]